MSKKAFTLVELIVVITILSVLATVAFISFQGYAASSRDSVRLSDIKSMEKVINLYRLTNSKYPTPNAETNITYSGSIAWTQGVFGTNAYTKNTNLSDIPVDPITGLPYAYSVTNIQKEYQIAAILEGEASFNNIQTYAGTQIANVFVRGDYNGKIIRVRKNTTDYILGVPSIIASDINDVRLETILTNQKLVYKGYSNLPASYSGSVYNANPLNGFSFSPNQVVLFEGDIDDLESNPSDRIDFLDNLQANYNNSLIQTEPGILDMLAIDSSSSYVANNYVATTLNNSLKTSIQILDKPITQSDIYHDMLTIMETKYANGEINGLINLEKIQLYNNKLYFGANDNANGNGLWVSDGTEAGTLFLVSITGNISHFIGYNGDIYTYTKHGKEGPEGGNIYELHMYKIDVSLSSADLITTITGTNFSNIIIYNNSLWFSAGGYLYKSDGTISGTNQFTQAGTMIYPFIYNNELYYTGLSTGGLFKTDGTNITHIQSFGSQVSSIYEYKNKLYFGTFRDDPRGIFVTDGSIAGTSEIISGEFVPETFQEINNILYFYDDYNQQIYETNGDGSIIVSANQDLPIFGVITNSNESSYIYYGYDTLPLSGGSHWGSSWRGGGADIQKINLATGETEIVFTHTESILRVIFGGEFQNEQIYAATGHDPGNNTLDGIWSLNSDLGTVKQLTDIDVTHNTQNLILLEQYNNNLYTIGTDGSLNDAIWVKKGSSDFTMYNLPVVIYTYET